MTRKRIGFTRLLDDTTAQQRYRLATEQIQHAERCGLTVLDRAATFMKKAGCPHRWCFLPTWPRTRHIRLGTGIIPCRWKMPCAWLKTRRCWTC